MISLKRRGVMSRSDVVGFDSAAQRYESLLPRELPQIPCPACNGEDPNCELCEGEGRITDDRERE